MGGTESTRKVSFAVDEEDNVRVLHGVKLSEEVLQRMRGATREADVRPPPGDSHREEPVLKPVTPDPPRPSPPLQPSEPPRPSEPLRPSESPLPSEPPRPSVAEVQEELRRRYEREQAIMREELVRITRREREAAREDLRKALRRERGVTHTEAERAKNLGKQLERKEAELKKQEAFYREKLTELEKKNLEYYKQAREQFREAANRMEARVKPRSTAPACPTLQGQILQCYRDNRDQTLRCSDLAKEYMQCIDAAKKNLLVNHG
ncbi:MICOS complex subunit mic25a-like isoform X2 [Anguilla anguilla]|uniref:MICOS complex subunit mic25a-like isoform X2 n=1 Tax=Anguilla anguilla TaxID=7936 RepID=UPI0015A87575|nr:MICOS complex subunit mic25a-like isoform X2 [Anguilla anguilla]